jgi:YidC/Oxa1 family membrane protein insertase
MFGFLDVPVSGAHHLVTWLASLSQPLTGQLGVALAIVVFTAGIRLLLLPLSKAAVRGEKARAALAPQLQALRKRHAGDGPRLQEEVTKLQQETGTSMFVGCLPLLLQIPFFMVMYRLFSSTSVGGEPNSLLSGSLFGTPLGDHFHGPVFVGIAVLLVVVAWFSSRWQAKTLERSGGPDVPGGRLMRLMPYGTVFATAAVPLAASLYLLTTTTWSVVERAVLRR